MSEQSRHQGRKAEEVRIPTSILHLEGPADTLTFTPSGKFRTVSVAMLNHCAPGVADRMDAAPFFIRDDASGCGRHWDVMANGGKVCILCNGVALSGAECVTLRFGDCISLADASSDQEPFLNLRVRFEVTIKHIHKTPSES